MLKSNEPNSISKDALRDEDYPWLINCTTQEYFVNVKQDSHFNSFIPKCLAPYHILLFFTKLLSHCLRE